MLYSQLPCIILAGGLGSRIKSVLHETPKSLAPINNLTFLQILIEHLSKRGISRFILALGFGHKYFIHELNKSWAIKYNISYIIEELPLNTGGAILNIMNTFSLKDCLVSNGDSLVSGDYTNFFNSINYNSSYPFHMALVNVSNRQRYGGVLIDNNSCLAGFSEKGSSDSGLINAGLYKLNISAFYYFNQCKSFSLEKDLLHTLIQPRKVTTKILTGKFIDIGVPQDYAYFVKNYQFYY
jgi:D-glycero-alpha-D-manno-heptose 1-phosphate guanylyltransferase